MKKEVSGYSAGPWHVSAYEGGWTCIRQGPGMGAIIAKLGLNHKPNAHLLAAAPKMLAALKGLLPNVEDACFCGESKPPRGEHWHHCQSALDAMAEAKGETFDR